MGILRWRAPLVRNTKVGQQVRRAYDGGIVPFFGQNIYDGDYPLKSLPPKAEIRWFAKTVGVLQ